MKIHPVTNWTAHKIICPFCTYPWVAVFVINTEELECPKCTSDVPISL